MVRNGFAAGRRPFSLSNPHKDYSGEDLIDVFLNRSSALSHAFLNGITANNCFFVRSKLDHAELAESSISNSQFHHVDLATSDLVRASISGCVFERCDFSNGEWRQTSFQDVVFKDCKFNHTTINLCNFSSCKFLGNAGQALDHRSVMYNTFSRCSFEDHVRDRLVLSRNFGLPSAMETHVPASGAATLENICILSSTGAVTVADLAEAIRVECAAPKIRLKKMRLEFISNIVSTLAAELRISPASLIYIEELFLQFARSARDEADFLAAMNAIVNLRNALYDLAVTVLADIRNNQEPCGGVVLRFKGTYSKPQAQAFVDALSEVIFGRPGDITIERIQIGSTIIDTLFSSMATVGAALGALNLLIGQASLTMEKAIKFQKTAQRFFRIKRQWNTRQRAATKIPAILNLASAVPQIEPVRRAVRRNGRTLILFDEPTTATLLPTPKPRKAPKRRRKKI